VPRAGWTTRRDGTEAGRAPLNRTRIARPLALFSYFGLLAWMMAWATWLHPSRHFPVALDLVVTVLPLTLTLFGMLHARVRSHLWTAYLSMLYVLHGSVEAWASPETRLLSLVELGLALLLFLSCAYYARWRVLDGNGPLETRDNGE